MFGLGSLSLIGTTIGASLIAGAGVTAMREKDLTPTNLTPIETTETLTGLTGKDGFIISKNIQLSEKACYEHILVVGPTGAGKSTTLFFPTLLSNVLPQNSSIIICDPKGELYKKTAWYQRQLGREPILFAPLDPQHSLKYNPLEQCRDVTEVRELAQSLLMNGSLAVEIATGRKSNDVVWINMAQPLWTALLLYCKEKGRPMNTISEAFKLLINHDEEELDAILSNASEDVQMQYKIFQSAQGAQAAIGSIKITLTTNIQVMTDPYLIETTRNSEFNPEILRHKPTALYIMYPEAKANYVSPFMACFYSQLINRIIEEFEEDNPKYLPVFVLFDEFCNIGMLNNFSQNIATIRSRKISCTICLQSITQLYQLYGKANALSILNNSKVKLIMPGLSDLESLNYASSLCGFKKETIASYSESSSISHGRESTNSSSSSWSYSVQRVKRYEPDEIRTLPDKTTLIIAHNKKPLEDAQNIYYEQKKYTDNVKLIKLPIT